MLNTSSRYNEADSIPHEKIVECKETWTFLMKPKLNGKSGKVHEFDYGFYLNGNEDFLVLGKQYGKDIRNGLSLLTYFNAQSDDVGADRKVIFCEREMPEEVELLASALKIVILNNVGDVAAFLSRSMMDNDPIGAVKFDISSILSLKNSKKNDKVTKKYRDRTMLIQEVLRSASSENGTTLNNLVFRCNLNYNSARKIVDELLRRELLGITKNGDDKAIYKTTGIGSQMIERLRVVNGGSYNEP